MRSQLRFAASTGLAQYVFDRRPAAEEFVQIDNDKISLGSIAVLKSFPRDAGLLATFDIASKVQFDKKPPQIESAGCHHTHILL